MSNVVENWDDINFFDSDEFDDPLVPGSGILIDKDLVETLDALRAISGLAIIPHNKFGLRGCVCVDNKGHASKSLHYVDNGAKAVDFHFKTNMDSRKQIKHVIEAGFGGIGFYYNWEWPGYPAGLPVGFHVDMRERYQLWTMKKSKYVYLLK